VPYRSVSGWTGVNAQAVFSTLTPLWPGVFIPALLIATAAAQCCLEAFRDFLYGFSRRRISHRWLTERERTTEWFTPCVSIWQLSPSRSGRSLRTLYPFPNRAAAVKSRFGRCPYQTRPWLSDVPKSWAASRSTPGGFSGFFSYAA